MEVIDVVAGRGAVLSGVVERLNVGSEVCICMLENVPRVVAIGGVVKDDGEEIIIESIVEQIVVHGEDGEPNVEGSTVTEKNRESRGVETKSEDGQRYGGDKYPSEYPSDDGKATMVSEITVSEATDVVANNDVGTDIVDVDGAVVAAVKSLSFISHIAHKVEPMK
ncbi:hypothetical protein MMC18_001973 [Xylographa bjoerkii]|nr:hypothetical protein [Xylographa bjoerkii]